MSHRIGKCTAALLLASLPAVFGRGAIAEASSLWTLAEPTGLYWGAGHEFLIGLVIPTVLASGMVLFLGPGLLLALASGRARTVPSLLLSAVPWAVGIAIANVVGATQLPPSVQAGFLPRLLPLASMLVCGAIASWRSARRDPPWPEVPAATRGALAVTAVATGLLYLVLIPKLFWENFNGDGAQAFEVARLLLNQPWPFFPPQAGRLSAFPGMTSLLFAYPDAWFMRLFGEVDASTRIPFLLYLPLLAIAMQAVIEEQRRAIGARAMTAIWLGLAAFAFAMAFSASYSPYSADIAMPAARETLLVLCYVGFVHAMIRREMAWAARFGLLTYVSLPTGLLLMVFWLVAESLVMRPVPKPVLIRTTTILIGFIALGIAATALLAMAGQPTPGREMGAGRAFDGLLRLNFTDWHRGLYWLVGAGIFPVLLLGRWRHQDEVSRRVTLVTLAYFGFFFVQSRFALHHLAPVMILPAIVAARMQPGDPTAQRRWLGLWQLLAALALWLSLPSSFEIERTARRLGMSGVQQVGDYRAGDITALRAGNLLAALFPFEWDPDVPGRSYGGAAMAWQHYTRQGAVDDQTVFLLGPSGAVAGRPIASEGGHTLYILDEQAWDRLRGINSRIDRHAAVYGIPQATLFGKDDGRIVNLRSVLRKVVAKIRGDRPD